MFVTDFGFGDDKQVMERVLSDAELLVQSVAEPRWFGEIYERHGVPVRRYVVRRVGLADAEDLTAEVFIKAFGVRDRYRPVYSSALPWLLGIANHVVGDHRRAEQRRLHALERLSRERPASPTPAAGLLPGTLKALRALKPVDRDTLLLMVWGELTRDEVAYALAVPVGTVNSRIARARKRLAAELAPTRTRRTTGLNGETHGEVV